MGREGSAPARSGSGEAGSVATLVTKEFESKRRQAMKWTGKEIEAPTVGGIEATATRLRQAIARRREESETSPEDERLRIADQRAQAAAAPDALRGGTGIAH
jgi:hypothetical protein